MYSFVLLAAVALLVVGILSVTAVHSKTIAFSPIFVGSSINQSYNFTITSGSGSATINEIRITKPGDFTEIYCLNAPPVGGWSCAANGTPSSLAYVEFTGGSLAAGSSVSINITSTSAAGAANYSFTIRTQGDGEAANSTLLNVTVDAHPPLVDLVNISDGTNVLDKTHVNGLFFLKNATKGIVFVINATDNSSGMGQGTVTVYYNLSTNSAPNNIVNLIDYMNASLANVSAFTASTGSYGESGLYNVTLNISAMKSLNGTRVAFVILANDSVHNGNLSNSSNTTAVSTFVYNFTVDAAAPQFVDVQIANQSLNAPTAQAINITSTLTSKVEHILNSSILLNVSALVRDDGGAGTIKVEVMDRTGAFLNMDLLTGSNGSTGSTTWNFSTLNISELVKSFGGDGLYNITFRATDNVSNVNSTYNFTVQVDDTPPTVSVTTNITIDASSILSAGNVTLSNTSLNNTAFVLRLITSNDINNNTANISVEGNLGSRYNFTYESGTPSGTSIWNLTVAAATAVNVTNFCAFGSTPSTFGPDASTCNLKFNVSDVMGRINNSVNLTIAVDSLAPNVSIDTPLVLLANYTGTVAISVSVNDSVGPLQNVSFRLITGSTNTTGAGGEGYYNTTTINVTDGANMTNWIPLTLSSGGNSQFSAHGYWSAIVNLTAINFTDNSYIIQINATDSVGRQNFSVNRTGVILDASAPQNISIVAPATNSFWNANFTINLNATERVSGLLNVTVRLENGTYNSSWVGVQQVFPDALSSVTGAGVTTRFNITNFNITHIGSGTNSVPFNATNGNFTLRLNVTDTAGNQNTSVTINFTIDTVQPSSVTLIAPANGLNQSSNFTINVSAVESNIASVQYRWENASDMTANEGQNRSNWINMNKVGNNWNATFNITEGTPADGNYTLKINVTDKAGWNVTTTYIQLVLDQNRPEVVAVGSLANSIQTNDFVINMTTRDNRSFTNTYGIFNISNINSTSVRLENNTFNGSWQNISFATTDLGNAGSNRTNVTFEFASVPNGVYTIRFAVNDTAGNQNSTVTIGNVTLDNVAPSVAFSILNLTPAVSGGTGVTGNISFNVTVSDNLPLNISITNNTNAQGNQYGVFFRIENSSMNNSNASWLPMSTISFNNFVQNNTGREHSAIFNLTNNATILYADGDYQIRINATDKAGNQNTSVFISFTIQNGGSKVRATNLTFQGGYVTGSDTNQTSPTFLVNTTTNSTCLYSVDTPVTNYDYFLPQTTANTMGNNISRQHSTPLGFLPDRAANGYAVYYVCKDVGGNFTATDGATSSFTFGVDTRNFFNITMGSGGTNKVRGDYFAVGWNSFTLPKTTLLANTGQPTNYNVTNVLSSLGNSKLTTANFTVIYSHNGSDWSVYRVGGGANTFSNFTADTPTAAYYINITTANERIEIN